MHDTESLATLPSLLGLIPLSVPTVMIALAKTFSVAPLITSTSSQSGCTLECLASQLAQVCILQWIIAISNLCLNVLLPRPRHHAGQHAKVDVFFTMCLSVPVALRELFTGIRLLYTPSCHEILLIRFTTTVTPPGWCSSTTTHFTPKPHTAYCTLSAGDTRSFSGQPQTPREMFSRRTPHAARRTEVFHLTSRSYSAISDLTHRTFAYSLKESSAYVIAIATATSLDGTLIRNVSASQLGRPPAKPSNIIDRSFPPITLLSDDTVATAVISPAARCSPPTTTTLVIIPMSLVSFEMLRFPQCRMQLHVIFGSPAGRTDPLPALMHTQEARAANQLTLGPLLRSR